MPLRNPAAATGLRILAGVALYVALLALWLAVGLDRVYDGYVLLAAEPLVPFLTHFPVGSAEGVEFPRIHNQAFVLVWIVALALVARGAPWKKRVVGYTSLAVVVVLLHIVALAFQIHLALALKSQQNLNLPLLLPWEVQGLKLFTQLLFLGSLQVAAFIALALTAFWSSQRAFVGRFGNGDEARSPSRWRDPARQHRALVLAGLMAVFFCVACTTAAWWIRETDPRHLAAHARVGDAFARQQMFSEAETQYRAAVRGEADAGRTWAALAFVVHRQGEIAETKRVLDRALKQVNDPAWRTRLEQARAEISD